MLYRHYTVTKYLYFCTLYYKPTQSGNVRSYRTYFYNNNSRINGPDRPRNLFLENRFRPVEHNGLAVDRRQLRTDGQVPANGVPSARSTGGRLYGCHHGRRRRKRDAIAFGTRRVRTRVAWSGHVPMVTVAAAAPSRSPTDNTKYINNVAGVRGRAEFRAIFRV